MFSIAKSNCTWYFTFCKHQILLWKGYLVKIWFYKSKITSCMIFLHAPCTFWYQYAVYLCNLCTKIHSCERKYLLFLIPTLNRCVQNRKTWNERRTSLKTSLEDWVLVFSFIAVLISVWITLVSIYLINDKVL